MRTVSNPSRADYAQLQPTRDYLQDIAKVLGKVQQIFIKPNAHDWQRGLEVIYEGLTTQALNNSMRIVIDMRNGILRAGHQTWQLKDYTAQAMRAELQRWLITEGREEIIAMPELVTSAPHFDPSQASQIADILTWAHDLLQETKCHIAGMTSPVLLYPHHFDVSLVYFEPSYDTQLNFGFSFGDEYVQEPYFYLTQYPETKAFLSRPLMPPTYWQTKGFHGAILRYNDAVKTDNSQKTIREYLQIGL